MGTTTVKGVPYPVDADPPDVPKDMGKLATWNDSNPGVAVLTSAARDALPAAQKWTGRVIYNTTTVTHEGYNGTAWVPIGAGVQVLSQAQIDALPAAMKTTGMIVWNTDTLSHQFLNSAGNWVYLEIPSLTQAQIGSTPLTKFGTSIIFDTTAQAHRYSSGLDFPFVADVPRVTTAVRDAFPSYMRVGGQIIWNTTTNRHEWYDSGAAVWRGLNPNTSGAYGVMARGSDTGGARTITGNAVWVDVAGCALTINCIAGRRYGLHAESVIYFANAGANCQLQIVRDGVAFGALSNLSVATAVQAFSMSVDADDAPTAGAHTYKLQIRSQTVGCQLDNGTRPATFRIEDMGEDAQVGTPTTIVPPDMWNAAWGEVAKAVLSTNTAAIGTTYTDIGLSVTFTPVIGRRYRTIVEGEMLGSMASVGVYGMAAITDSVGVLLRRTIVPITSAGDVSFAHFYDESPSTATPLVRKVQATTSQGTVTLRGAGTPVVLTVVDIGPANPASTANWPPKNPYVQQGYAVVTLNGPAVGATATVGAEQTLVVPGGRISFSVRADIQCLNFGASVPQVATFTMEASVDGGATWPYVSAGHQLMAGVDSGINRANGSCAVAVPGVTPTGAVKARLRCNNSSMVGISNTADMTWTVAPAS